MQNIPPDEQLMEPADYKEQWATTEGMGIEYEESERLSELWRLDNKCEQCGHAIKLHHDRYGCQYERGDRWVDWGQGDRLVAMGPCGCKLHNEVSND